MSTRRPNFNNADLEQAFYYKRRSFGNGYTIKFQREALLWATTDGGDGNYYVWAGALPKAVPANSTPANTGGISISTWRNVGDGSISWEYKSINGASQIGLNQGGTVQDSLTAITPEMFGAKGDGVADDTAAVQAALSFAYSMAQYRIVGKGRYRIFRPVTIDNFGQGLTFHLQDVIADESFPATSDWKTANGMFEIGGLSNGSQVGLDIKFGYSNGKDVATVIKLKGYGCGGSTFRPGRVENVIGVIDITNSNLSGSSSNTIIVDYWRLGLYGVRIRRSGSMVAEGTKIVHGFMTGFKYGGIQLFNGSQYFHISGVGIDFCGRNLTQLTVDAMPPVSVRETMLTNNNTGNQFEILDVYQQFSGIYSILAIEPVSSENGSTNFSVGQVVNAGGVDYTISAVTTSVTAKAYFDFIHGFQGAPFSRGYAGFDYLSRAVGGNFNGTTMYFFNSFTEITNVVNNVWTRNQGIAVSFVDRWSGTVLANWATPNGNMTIPAGIITGTGTSTFNGAVAINNRIYTGGSRVFGSEYSLTLSQSVTTPVRTFSFVGNGTVTTTKEMYDVVVTGPVGLNGVGGSFQVFVGSSGIELRNVNVGNITVSASGYTLQAFQAGQPSMVVTFMYIRRM